MYLKIDICFINLFIHFVDVINNIYYNKEHVEFVYFYKLTGVVFKINTLIY